MIVRWLGAFGHSRRGLAESIEHELSASGGTVVCAERINIKKGLSRIRHAHVGLVVKNCAVVRRFKGDVWSMVREETGKRIKTRKPVSTHTEVWCKPDYCAIVVDAKISRRAWQVCRKMACTHNLDLLRVTRDRRIFAVK